jgi:hypothetical protein
MITAHHRASTFLTVSLHYDNFWWRVNTCLFVCLFVCLSVCLWRVLPSTYLSFENRYKNTVTVYLNCPTSVTIFCKLAVSTDPSQGIYTYRGIEAALLILQLFTRWDSTSDFQQPTPLHARSRMSKNQATCGKTPCIAQTMNTCALKQENSILIWKTGVPDLYPCSYRQLHSLSSHFPDCLVRDLNYGPWPVTPYFELLKRAPQDASFSRYCCFDHFKKRNDPHITQKQCLF